MFGFWLFMFATSLLIPLSMLLFGAVFRKGIPEEMNALFGYRTKRSRKNKDTWAFAHRHVGRIWMRAGAVMLVLTLVAMPFLHDEAIETVGLGGGLVVIVQAVVLVSSLFPTEMALKRTFDEDGNRKEVPGED